MSSFRAETIISEDRGVHLKQLPFTPGDEVIVTVTKARPRKRTWPKGYFESTFGAITDASFKRHPQGEYESRETNR